MVDLPPPLLPTNATVLPDLMDDRFHIGCLFRSHSHQSRHAIKMEKKFSEYRPNLIHEPVKYLCRISLTYALLDIENKVGTQSRVSEHEARDGSHLLG